MIVALVLPVALPASQSLLYPEYCHMAELSSVATADTAEVQQNCDAESFMLLPLNLFSAVHQQEGATALGWL